MTVQVHTRYRNWFYRSGYNTSVKNKHIEKLKVDILKVTCKIQLDDTQTESLTLNR